MVSFYFFREEGTFNLIRKFIYFGKLFKSFWYCHVYKECSCWQKVHQSGAIMESHKFINLIVNLSFSVKTCQFIYMK